MNIATNDWGYWHMQVLCVQQGVQTIRIWSSQTLLSQWNLAIITRRDAIEWCILWYGASSPFFYITHTLQFHYFFWNYCHSCVTLILKRHKMTMIVLDRAHSCVTLMLERHKIITLQRNNKSIECGWCRKREKMPHIII